MVGDFMVERQKASPASMHEGRNGLDAVELIKARRVHLARLANKKGALGEADVVSRADCWVSRPKGRALAVLLHELKMVGITIKGSSFDAIFCPLPVDFANPDSVRSALCSMVFIEIKTSNQKRVKPGFTGFFFAITESEISASDQLGPRHKVALYNRMTDELLLTSVPAIIARARSMTWQLSVQL